MSRARQIAALTHEIMAVHPETFAPASSGTVEYRATVTSTGMTVVRLVPSRKAPGLILKVASTPQSRLTLEREAAVLTALHANDALGAWRSRVPTPLARGMLGSHAYRIESAISGRVIVNPAPTARLRLLRTAAETIAELHASTAVKAVGHPQTTQRWVDAPIRQLSRHLRPWPWQTERLRRLGDELREALAHATFRTVWIHGDYWLGNLLFADDDHAAGIVDWEAAAPLELPLHDFLHLVLYTRRLATGTELGRLLCELLGRPRWRAYERALLDHFHAWPSTASLSHRHALLLYWLRHAALHARQQQSFGYRYRIWEQRNVLPILAAV
jgi:aminoglycoside phosphotransferase (APT) family kinase protein